MAERYAVATGNWSDVATWDGGVALPASGDTVHPNGFIVTIDQDVDVYELTTKAGATAASNGRFLVDSTGHTVNARIIAGFTSNSWYGTLYVSMPLPSDELTIISDVVELNQSASSNNWAIYIRDSGTVNLTVNGFLSTLGHNNSTGIINVPTGDVDVNFVGDIVGHGYSHRYSLRWVSAGALNVTGNIVAYKSSNRSMALSVENGTATITGDVDAGPNTDGFSLSIGGGNDHKIVGDVTASLISPAVVGGPVTGGKLTVEGSINSNTTSAQMAVAGQYCRFAIPANDNLVANFVEEGTTNVKSLYTGGTDIGNPATTDVRSGTTFGPSNQYTGTLAIPSGQYVSLGVPVDSGVGTLAHLDASGIRSAIGLSSADLGTTLTNVQNNTNLIPGLF